MHFSVFSVLGLLAGSALAECPYAASAKVKRNACPYAEKEVSASDYTPPRAFSPRSTNGSSSGMTTDGTKGVMFMNRIAPSVSVLYVANADGSNARQLLTGNNSVFEYHASFSQDGQWITFTTERAGDGQSDVYRVRTNGSNIEPLVATKSFEDAGMYPFRALIPSPSWFRYAMLSFRMFILN